MLAFNRIASILFAAVVLVPTARATTTFALTPATISGAPGSTVGWGFTIFNDTDYLVVSSADFTPANPLGTFTDFIAQFNFIVVGPAPESTSVSQPFDLNALTGVGSYAISAAALSGNSIVGQISLTYDLFSRSPNDPDFNPDTDLVSVGNSISTGAEVDVASAAVPEPATYGLVGMALLIGAFALRARKRQAAHAKINPLARR